MSGVEYVGPVNLLAGFMFSQVDVTLQGKSITSTTSHYPYTCMFQTLLSYCLEANNSQLTSQLFIKDTPVALDDNDVKIDKNNGLFSRSLYFEGSKTVDLEGPLIHPELSSHQYKAISLERRILSHNQQK